MTEDEWRSCEDPRAILTFLGRKASARKLRLFACACCRHAWHVVQEPSRQAIETAERYADGQASEEERQQALKGANSVAVDQHFHAADAAAEVIRKRPDAREVVDSVASDFAVSCLRLRDSEKKQNAAFNAEYRAQCRRLVPLAHDVFGNPFRRVVVAPAWRAWDQGAIGRLAAAIYDDRAFDRLPVLADALEEAGCDNADLLAHCRGPGPHVRGCWVVDLLLGRR